MACHAAALARSTAPRRLPPQPSSPPEVVVGNVLRNGGALAHAEEAQLIQQRFGALGIKVGQCARGQQAGGLDAVVHLEVGSGWWVSEWSRAGDGLAVEAMHVMQAAS